MGNVPDYNIRISNINRVSIQRARPLLYVFALVSAWILARLIFTLSTTQASDIEVKLMSPNILAENDNEGEAPYLAYNEEQKVVLNRAIPNDIAITSDFISYIKDDKITSVQDVTSNDLLYGGGLTPKALYPLLFLAAAEERSTAIASKGHMNIFNNIGRLPSGRKLPLVSNQGRKEQYGRSSSHNLASRLSGYAYIFARTENGNADSLGARYGGSQAAVQAAYRINPNQKIVWDATLRAQAALNDSDKEIAAGLRVKPHDKFPLSLVAEHRFRPSNADGFALYAAGGQSAIVLPKNFRLDVYGQAGVSIAGKDTLFFDGQAVVSKPIHKSKNITISAGGGAWAGGQSDAQRLDIGPSVSITLSQSKQNYRISGDWRERVSGNAAPTSGAAITLSADF